LQQILDEHREDVYCLDVLLQAGEVDDNEVHLSSLAVEAVEAGQKMNLPYHRCASPDPPDQAPQDYSRLSVTSIEHPIPDHYPNQLLETLQGSKLVICDPLKSVEHLGAEHSLDSRYTEGYSSNHLSAEPSLPHYHTIRLVLEVYSSMPRCDEPCHPHRPTKQHE